MPFDMCRYSAEDLERAGEICRAYRRQFHLGRGQLALMLSARERSIADIESARHPGRDRLLEQVFALEADLE